MPTPLTMLLASLLWFTVSAAWAETNEAVDESGGKAPAATAGDTAEVEGILNQVEKTLRELPAYAYHLEVVINVSMRDMKNEMTSKYDIRVEKPRKWAVVQRSGMIGGTSISDGAQVTNYMPMLKRYVVEPLPEDLALGESTMPNSMMMMGPAGHAPVLLGKDFTRTVMEGVTEAKVVGEEEVDGEKCWRLAFEQEGFSWELWIAKGEQPLPRKATAKPDLSARAEQMPEQMKDMSMDVLIEFKDWDLEADFADEDFTFDPPAGAKKVDSLLEGMGGSDEPHALLGEPAPEFELETLDGESFNLTDAIGKKVVMLDFWATWCGPCVQALPEVTAAAEEMREKGVVFYAVNLREEADDVREFLKEKEIEAPVLLDSDGEVGQQYQANAIPQTVIIGKDGRVQVVHVGFGPGAKKTLIKELTALVDGEDLATKTLEKLKKEETADDTSASIPSEPHGLKEAWSHTGSYQSVAVDPKSGVIYALQRGGIAGFDSGGEEQEVISTKVGGRNLRQGNLAGDAAPEFLLFDPWGQEVVAVGRDGKRLWHYPGESGIDDVWAADLDGDEIDEVIVGLNGDGGLHVLKSNGKRLWANNSIGNVWHVSAGTLTSEEMQVISTSAQGQLHIFDCEDGESVDNFDAGLYANYVRIIPTPGSKQPRAVVAGSGDRGELMALLDGKGEVVWTITLPGNGSHTDSIGADADGKVIVVGQRGGVVSVHDSDEGNLLGIVGGMGDTPSVAVASNSERVFLVLVATGKRLTAYYSTPMKPLEALESAEDQETEVKTEAPGSEELHEEENSENNRADF